MCSGIYLIINQINCKLYVGSSSNIQRRFSNHRNKLENNKHPNKHLQSAWNSYGADAFKFVIVEECDFEKLAHVEQLWIDASKCYLPSMGYNLR